MSIRIITLCIVIVTVFSPVHADNLDYKPGELIVRFEPKEDKSQLSRTEKTQILYLQLKGMLDIMR